MIRTYTRKPPECQYIDGVLGLCRLCLQRAEEAVPIFTDERADICSSVALRIMFCVGLELKREENLPNHICLTCHKELERYYTFRKKCEVSYQKLKSHTQAIQNRIAAEALSLATEDALKRMDEEQEEQENVTVDELELMMGTEEGYGVLEIEATPVNDVPSDIVETNDTKAETKDTKAGTKDTKADMKDTEAKMKDIKAKSLQESVEPAELSSMISAVLVKLGLLTRAGPLLGRRGAHPTHLQLETADGAVVRMEVVEEDDDDEDTQEQDDSYQGVLKAENERVVSAKQEEAILNTIGGGGYDQHVNEGKTKKATRRRRGTAAGAACARCGRVLASASALRRHARTHSGERPYACARCQRSFAQKEVMRRHMLVHDEVRPHQCPQCPKSFTQRNGLLLHARSHLPPQQRALALHACPTCPKLFLYSSGLSRHMSTHSGRLYECGACHKQFADKSSVLRHVRRANHQPVDAGDQAERGQQ